MLSPGTESLDRASRQAELIRERLTSEGWPVAICPPGERSNSPRSGAGAQFGLPRLLGCVRSLICGIPQANLVHVLVSTLAALVWYGIPAIVLSRFFGRKLILQLPVLQTVKAIKRHRTALMPFLRLVDQILVSSDTALRELRSAGLKGEKAVDLVDPDHLQTRHITRLQPRILVACRQVPENNVTSIIRAVIQVKQKYPRAELVILGDGRQRKELESSVAKANLYGIEFVGDIDTERAMELLNEVDLYVNAADTGGIPNLMLEALGTGIPVISTAGGAVSEIVTDGYSGLLFDVGDEVTLSNHIIKLVEQDQLVAYLSKCGRAEAEKHAWDNLERSWKQRYLTAARR